MSQKRDLAQQEHTDIFTPIGNVTLVSSKKVTAPKKSKSDGRFLWL
jgi:hypothetical protein